MAVSSDRRLSWPRWKILVSVGILIWTAAQIYTGFAYHLNLPEHTGIPQIWPFRYTYYMFIRDTPWLSDREIWGQKANYEWIMLDADQHFRYPVSYTTRRHEEVNFPGLKAWRELASYSRQRFNETTPADQPVVRIYIRDCIWQKQKGKRPGPPPLNQCPYYQPIYDSYTDADFSAREMGGAALPRSDGR